MAKKINWQEHTGNTENKFRWQLFSGWLKHTVKILMCLVFVLIAFYYLILPQIKANYFYASTRCLVMSSRMEPLSKKVTNSGFQPKFLVVYEVDKKIYTHWAYDILNNIITNPEASKTIAGEVALGKYYMCWYDKTDPHKVVLKRGWDHISVIFFLMTIIVLLTSITGFYRWFRQRNVHTEDN